MVLGRTLAYVTNVVPLVLPTSSPEFLKRRLRKPQEINSSTTKNKQSVDYTKSNHENLPIQLKQEQGQRCLELIKQNPKNFKEIGSMTLFSPELLSMEDSLPPHMTHRWIVKGYRTPVADVKLVAQQSFLTYHNETGEIYTALFSALFFCYTSLLAWNRLDEWNQTRQPYAKVGFFALLSTEILAHVVSCLTHAFWTHSRQWHAWWCKMDYLMIFTSGYGKALCLYSLEILKDASLSRWFVWAIGLAIPFSTCILLTWKPWVSQQHRAALVGFTVCLIFYPLYRLLHFPNYISRPIVYWWSWYCITLIIGGFIYVSRYPERKWQGFDMLGHSHQLWHICAFLANYFAFCALWEMYRLI